MNYKKLHDQNGFTHVLVVSTLLILLLIGIAGYRVHTTTGRKNLVTITPSPQPANDKKPNQEQPEATTQAAPTDPPPSPTPKKPTAASPQPIPIPAFTSSIEIRGDTACQSSTLTALQLLSLNASTHYTTATKYISVIECIAQGSGMYAYENPPRYVVGDATRNAGTAWYASTIAHDSGHSKLYHDYLSAHPGQTVPEDVWTGEAAERTCLEAQYDALAKIGGTQSQLDYVKNIIDSQYYNVPYDQRWW